MKKCINCQVEKELNKFYFRNDNNSYRTTCRECFKTSVSKYRNDNPKKIKDSKLKYYYNNQDLCCERSNNWYLNNKDEKNKKHTVYIRNRRQTDIYFKLYSNIQSRIYSALKTDSKTDKTLKFLGCSIRFYKKWLEFQFDEYMNWDNHGIYWHIDHVKPCASFNFSIESEITACFNWKNVRPIEKTLNLQKNDKINNTLINLHTETVKSFATKIILKRIIGSEKKSEV